MILINLIKVRRLFAFSMITLMAIPIHVVCAQSTTTNPSPQSAWMVYNPANINRNATQKSSYALFPDQTFNVEGLGFLSTPFYATRGISKQISADNYYPQSGEQYAAGMLQWAASYRVPSWEWSVFSREEGYARANRDALDIILDDAMHGAIETVGNYSPYYDVARFNIQGARMGYAFPTLEFEGWNINMGAAASLFKGVKWYENHVSGTIQVEGRNQYTITAQEDRLDSKQRTSNWNRYVADKELSAKGWTLDFALQATHPDGAHLFLVINDLLSKSDWQNVPYLIQTAKNVTTHTNDRNIPTGRVLHRDFTYSLPRKIIIGGGYPWGDAIIEASMSRVDGKNYPLLGISKLWDSDNNKYRVNYHQRWKALEFKWAGKWMTLGLMSNHINFNRATLLGLSLSASY